jgi:hypothetical protein
VKYSSGLCGGEVCTCNCTARQQPLEEHVVDCGGSCVQIYPGAHRPLLMFSIII